MEKPATRPSRTFYSSGPCAKRPGWSLDSLSDAALGRSHRSKLGKAKLAEAIDKTRHMLALPDGYRVGIVPGSDTGAFEMAMWSMLGARGVDVLAWESFSKGWAADITKHLKLEDARVFEAPYGELPDLDQVSFDRDVVFAWNGTTSGVRVCPTAIGSTHDRKGLTLCDATSAVFAQPLPWEKLDVVTYSWQKVLGGEAAHGMLILGPTGGRTPRELHASLAPAQSLPPDPGRQVERGHLQGLDHQHPEHALRGGLSRRPELGRVPGRRWMPSTPAPMPTWQRS